MRLWSCIAAQPTFAAAALVWVAACGSDGLADLGDTSVTGPVGTHPSDEDTSAPDSAETGLPVWWSLDGTLTVGAGEVDLGASSLTVTLRSRDLAEVCASTHEVVGAEGVDPADDDLYALWSVTLADADGCTWPVPTTFELGVGPYDPRLDPALAPTGLDAQAVFGLYLRPVDQPLYVFGVVGTAEQMAGTPAAAPPLPDGAYSLAGLHLLPL